MVKAWVVFPLYHTILVWSCIVFKTNGCNCWLQRLKGTGMIRGVEKNNPNNKGGKAHFPGRNNVSRGVSKVGVSVISCVIHASVRGGAISTRAHRKWERPIRRHAADGFSTDTAPWWTAVKNAERKHSPSGRFPPDTSAKNRKLKINMAVMI